MLKFEGLLAAEYLGWKSTPSGRALDCYYFEWTRIAERGVRMCHFSLD